MSLCVDVANLDSTKSSRGWGRARAPSQRRRRPTEGLPTGQGTRLKSRKGVCPSSVSRVSSRVRPSSCCGVRKELRKLRAGPLAAQKRFWAGKCPMPSTFDGSKQTVQTCPNVDSGGLWQSGNGGIGIGNGSSPKGIVIGKWLCRPQVIPFSLLSSVLRCVPPSAVRALPPI